MPTYWGWSDGRAERPSNAAEYHALTYQSHRLARQIYEAGGFEYAALVDLGVGAVAADEAHGAIFEVGHSHLRVLGYVHHHGTRAAARCDVEGFGQRFGNILGAFHLTVPFGHRLRYLDEVHLLKGVRAERLGSHLPAYEHHGRRVEHGVGESRHGIGRPGARGDDADSRAAAGAGISLRGVQRALLVTHQNVVQFVAIVVKSVVYGDYRSSRVSEHGVDAFGQKRPDYGFGTRYARQRGGFGG